jgi:hypothetical protein
LYKKIYNFVGLVVVVLSVLFLGKKILLNISRLNFSSSTIFYIFVGSIFYALFYYLLCFGWLLFVRILNKEKSILDILYIYTRCSIGKYFPGNVGHYVGRQFIASRIGISQKVIAFASMLEIICQITSAVIICAWIDLPIAPPVSPVISLFVAILILAVAPYIILKIIGSSTVNLNKNISIYSLWKTICSVCVLDLLFFISSGCIFYVFVINSQSVSSVDFMTVISIYTAAWFLGIATPGAPAGIGVREAVMTAMLAKFLSEPDALSVAILFRATTTLGDLFFFGSSFALSNFRRHKF